MSIVLTVVQPTRGVCDFPVEEMCSKIWLLLVCIGHEMPSTGQANRLWFLFDFSKKQKKWTALVANSQNYGF